MRRLFCLCPAVKRVKSFFFFPSSQLFFFLSFEDIFPTASLNQNNKRH